MDCSKTIHRLFSNPCTREKAQEHVNLIYSNNITYMSGIQERDFARRNYGYAIPCTEMLWAIKQRSTKVVEIGAGSGYLTKLINLNGVGCVATDLKTWKSVSYDRHFKVLKMSGIAAVKKYWDRDVLISWPYFKGYCWDAKAILAMRPGRILYYIGEGYGGCTGTDEFHEVVQSEFIELEEIAIPQWYGLYDSMVILKRK